MNGLGFPDKGQGSICGSGSWFLLLPCGFPGLTQGVRLGSRFLWPLCHLAGSVGDLSIIFRSHFQLYTWQRLLPILFFCDTSFFFALEQPGLGNSCGVKGVLMSGFSVRFSQPSCSSCNSPESCVSRPVSHPGQPSVGTLPLKFHPCSGTWLVCSECGSTEDVAFSNIAACGKTVNRGEG